MTTSTTRDPRIVVIASGWVFAGDYHAATETVPAHITDAVCVRAWGTIAGLGELALKGPTKNTKLDPAGVVVLDNPQSMLFTLKCQYTGAW